MGWGLRKRAVRGQILTATDGRDIVADNTPDGWEVEQPWLWWTAPPGGGSLVFGNPPPGAGGWNSFVSIPGVARATSLIVDTIATLPWHVIRNETEHLTTPSWITDPQALRLDGRVVTPTDLHETRMSNVDVWGQWIQSALWFGDGFLFVPFRDEAGAPRPPLYVLHPLDVVLQDGAYYVVGSDVAFGPGEIVHLRGQLPIVGGRGTGVLQRFAYDLGLIGALRDYMTNAFTAGVPAGYLKTSAPNLTAEQADALKSRWIANHGGRRSIAVLNATTEFHPLTWSPVDVGAADFSRISLGQISLMFGLPAYLLGAPTDSATYANVESRMTELYELTLLPWIRRIEAVLDAQLPRGTEVAIVIDGLLRADTKTRYEAYQIALTQGFLTVDEVRELEGRQPIPVEVLA
jgi:HK97 family phage portal protein